ncbi:TRAP transporter small permease [Arsenicitalea aurantiaca]|uniref:TRAP transporter small permease protein n=1 Tax=Arsenicitalea aurantiaca TaxID=1783274 RepID=A0A433XKF4_9HYPH|nr:TRAP transporter small permease [Arsenicitalea aurantiaca]RUT34549.1 TRAP transporter small permease [Arsenicitalea aurantiaca]
MMMRILGSIDRVIGFLCKYLSIAMLVALFILLGLSIILRLVPLFTISGYDEVVEFLFIWIIVLTTVALWREGGLYRVSLFENLLPQAGQLVLSVIINLAMLGFALMLAWYGWQFAANAGETTPFLRMNKVYWHAALPVGGILMSIYSVVWLWRVVAERRTLAQDNNLIG